MADIIHSHPAVTATNHNDDQVSLPQVSDGVSQLKDSNESKEFAQALLSSGQDKDGSDDRFVTGKWELFSYYGISVAQSGLGLYNFAPSQFQNLLSLQATNLGNGMCGNDGQPECRLRFAGQDRTVTSLVLLCNGISFVIQAVLFIAIGSFADYGKFRPYILMAGTVVGVAIGFAWLGVTKAEQWEAATALYIVGLIAYNFCLSYFTAAFPMLARNLPTMRDARRKLVQDTVSSNTSSDTKEVDDKAATPEAEEPNNWDRQARKLIDDSPMTAEKYSTLETMSLNRISNIAFTAQSAGELIILAIIQGMLYGIHADRDEQSNTTALSAVVGFSAGAFLLCSIPWFVLEKRRPGQPLPAGTNYLTAAIKQAYLAVKYLKHLKQTAIYLVFYFLFNDALSTTVTNISIVQNNIVSFSTIKLNLLLIVGIAAQGVGIYAYWLVQRRWKLSTLFMFGWVVVFVILSQGWGFIGIFTQRFGFHHEYEIWLWQLWYGLFVCSWYAYSQTMVAEVTPKSFEFLFFSLFNLVGKGSSFLGPLVTQAIANKTGNASSSFYFLLPLSLASCILLWPLDLKKSKVEQARFIELQAKEKSLNKGDLAMPDSIQTVAQDA